jgi:hypothetical protein
VRGRVHAGSGRRLEVAVQLMLDHHLVLMELFVDGSMFGSAQTLFATAAATTVTIIIRQLLRVTGHDCTNHWHVHLIKY